MIYLARLWSSAFVCSCVLTCGTQRAGNQTWSRSLSDSISLLERYQASDLSFLLEIHCSPYRRASALESMRKLFSDFLSQTFNNRRGWYAFLSAALNLLHHCYWLLACLSHLSRANHQSADKGWLEFFDHFFLDCHLCSNLALPTSWLVNYQSVEVFTIHAHFHHGIVTSPYIPTSTLGSKSKRLHHNKNKLREWVRLHGWVLLASSWLLSW